MYRNQYDTDVTTWSPQGRLFQVEYAMEAVKQGSAIVGVTSKTHAVLAAIKRSPSELASYQQKVFRIDDHLGMAMSGLTADGRSLCKAMRGACLNHKYVYGSAMQTERLITQIADKHQRATQSYVRRPYGIGLLVAGYDRTGSHLFQTDPSGNYYEWKAMAIGSRSQSAKTYLERNFEKFTDLSREELIREAVRALHGCLEPEKELEPASTTIAIVGLGEAFHILEGDAVAPYIAGLGPASAPGGAAAMEEEEAKVPEEEAPAAGAGAAGAGEGAAPEGGMDVI